MKTARPLHLAAAVTIVIVVTASLVASACTDVWGPLDNPADPGSSSYQGYETVKDPDEIQPADPDSGIVTYTPRFIAEKVAGATLYQFRVSADPAFGSVLWTSPEVNTNDYLPTGLSGLSATTTYYWQVRAKVNDVWGAWSTTSATFSLSAAQTDTASPVHLATITDTTPAFDWSDVTGATGYRIQLSTVDTFATTVTDDGSLTASAYTQTTTLANDTTYYWRLSVKSVDGSWGPWMAARSFTINWNPTITPTSPTNVGTTPDTTPLLQWSAASGAVSYESQVATTSDAIDSAAIMESTVPSFQVATAIPDGGTRYWRVRPKNADGVYGAWQGPWSFSVAMVRPTLSAPAASATITDTTPALDWSDVTGSTGYRIQIAPMDSFVATILDDDTLSSSAYTLSAPLNNDSTYWWRVAVRNDDGVWSNWSVVRSFTMAFGTITGLSPAPDSTTFDSTPLLDWDDAENAVSYALRIAESEVDLASATVVTTDVSSYQITETLASDTTLWWVVRAVDVNDIHGSWTNNLQFRMASIPTMITIPAGTFQMGSVYSGEQPIHTVTLSSFRISATEITQSQYQAVIGNNPSSFHANTDAATCPVEQVSWYDALVFCNTLSILEGLAPVYSISGSTDPVAWGAVPTNYSTWDEAVMNPGANGYRLPTEAEWEYAARGETTTLYFWGDDAADATVSQYGWYTFNSGSKTHGVGQKPPNAYGLYDMAGNVWEWCWDWFGSPYPSESLNNPTGPQSSSLRVLRGGSWSSSSDDLRSAWRGAYYQYARRDCYGLRIVASALNPANIVHYEINGSTSGTAPTDSNTYAQGTTVYVQENTGNLFKANCVFTGWNTKMDGTGTTYQPGETFTMGTSSITLYAKWELGIAMVTIPAGTFQMGSNDYSNEQPVHSVTLSSFRMSTTEITQNQYQTVMGTNPSYFTSNANAGTCPVEQVNWYDALVFCNKLSISEGLNPVYSISGSINPTEWGTVPAIDDDTWDAVVMNRSANGYRLPTESESEYAARGGTISAFYWGDSTADTMMSQYAWYNYNSAGMTHPVGEKSPNAYGLYDISGNVSEWCWDWYASTYDSEVPADPVGPSLGTDRVRRGGKWTDSAVGLRSAYRYLASYPSDRAHSVGFRVVAPDPDATYHVLYNGNGNTGGLVPNDSATYIAGTQVAVSGNSGSLVKAGYFFDGWNTKADGSGVTYRLDDVLNVGFYSVTLYAKWSLVEMVTIPGGTFQMGGSGSTDEQPIHTVSLSAFLMSATEITQSQYQVVMGINPSYYSGNADAGNCPVESITWYDAIEFCIRLSLQKGLTPVYTLTERLPASGYPIISAVVVANLVNNGYRLPTEAQWEYAARGGTTSTFYWGESTDDAVVGQYAWYINNSNYSTHSVGSKNQNEFGLFDMAGNVEEMCWDFYSSTYIDGMQTDPIGPLTGSGHVTRGGYWQSEAVHFRTAARNAIGPSDWSRGTGFRVVLQSSP